MTIPPIEASRMKIESEEAFEVHWMERIGGLKDTQVLKRVMNRGALDSFLLELAIRGIVPRKVRRINVHTLSKG